MTLWLGTEIVTGVQSLFTTLIGDGRTDGTGFLADEVLDGPASGDDAAAGVSDGPEANPATVMAGSARVWRGDAVNSSPRAAVTSATVSPIRP